MQWLWDVRKDATNRAKHGLPRRLGAVGLADPLAVSAIDPHPDGNRWNTLCLIGSVVLYVVHTWPDDEEYGVGRIISVRRATRHERRRYQDG